MIWPVVFREGIEMPGVKKPYQLSVMDRAAKRANRAALNLIDAGGVFAEQKQRLGDISDVELHDWYARKGIVVGAEIIHLSSYLFKQVYGEIK